MRINQKMVERLTKTLNTPNKIVHVCHRNDAYAIDNAKQDECYNCGITTREAYMVLKGIQIGLQLAEEAPKK
ncbi:MAG: hypothetical protein P9L97_05825 [Candidatus Tenebribacter davisii]|nr:hypothetical protein [Candidatus Tenebribacter davisii]